MKLLERFFQIIKRLHWHNWEKYDDRVTKFGDIEKRKCIKCSRLEQRVYGSLFKTRWMCLRKIKRSGESWFNETNKEM